MGIACVSMSGILLLGWASFIAWAERAAGGAVVWLAALTIAPIATSIA